jgi:hypothetical protein
MEGVIDDEVAEKLEDGGPWETRDLPLVGESLVRVERYIDVHGGELSETGALEVQRIYFDLQRTHNELLFRTGMLPAPSEEGLRRRALYERQLAELKVNDARLSEQERAERSAALKETTMRIGEPAGQEHGEGDTGETR